MRNNFRMALQGILCALTIALTFPTSAAEERSGFVSLGGLTNWSNAERTQKVLAHRWWTDLSVGYTPSSFFSIGAIYAIDQDKVTTSGFSLSSNNFESRDYRTSIGPQIHFWFEPFYLSAAYFINSKRISELTTDGLSPYQYDGTGSAFEFGFLYPVGTFRFSFSVLYRTWKETDRSQNGGGTSALSPVSIETRLDPSLKAWWVF